MSYDFITTYFVSFTTCFYVLDFDSGYLHVSKNYDHDDLMILHM